MAVPQKFLMNISDAALVVGISVTALYKYGVDPVVDNGKEKLYDIREMVRRRMKNVTGTSGDSKLVSEKTRLTQAQADEAELKVQERKGDVIQIDVAEKVLSEQIFNLKAKLDSAHIKYAPRLDGLETTAERAEVLRSIFKEASQELRSFVRLDYTSIPVDTEDTESDDESIEEVNVNSPKKQAAKKNKPKSKIKKK